MSVWSAPKAALLSCADGELISVRIVTDPRNLEDVLDALADIPFPVNPQIRHGKPTQVEFPAYAGRLPEVSETLAKAGLDDLEIRVNPILTMNCR